MYEVCVAINYKIYTIIFLKILDKSCIYHISINILTYTAN